MNDLLVFYIVTMAFVSVNLGLLLVYRYFLGNRLTQQANKLKSQIANLKQNFPELEDRRRDIVASGIGEIGIEGIMQELGIDPGIIKNPLVKGLIEKYAPRVIEQLSKGSDAKQESVETRLL